jgi:hypothetical protein
MRIYKLFELKDEELMRGVGRGRKKMEKYDHKNTHLLLHNICTSRHDVTLCDYGPDEDFHSPVTSFFVTVVIFQYLMFSFIRGAVKTKTH